MFTLTHKTKEMQGRLKALHIYFTEDESGVEKVSSVISDGERIIDSDEVVSRSIRPEDLSGFIDVIQAHGLTPAQAQAFLRDLGIDPWLDKYEDARQA